MDDAAAAAFYENPSNREPVGSGRKRATRPAQLTSHVPIRFDPETIEAVKRLADDDGRTVSGWIRAVVNREIRERQVTILVTRQDNRTVNSLYG